jgi:DNA invertase Pin-like site-specific DNA recombinase
MKQQYTCQECHDKPNRLAFPSVHRYYQFIKGSYDGMIMTPPGKRYVTYVRVSTQKQGASGLGLEAQQRAVADFLAAHQGHVVAEYREVESGKLNERPQLQAALKRCRQSRAVLLVAKLDRLSRSASFLLNLRDSGVRFICADMPDANELTIGVLAAVAQHEREAISARTTAALAAAKARGARLGNPNLAAGSAATAAVARLGLVTKADAFANDLRDVIEAAQADGLRTLQALAARLNELQCQTPRGGQWTPIAVSRTLDRLGLRSPERRAT